MLPKIVSGIIEYKFNIRCRILKLEKYALLSEIQITLRTPYDSRQKFGQQQLYATVGKYRGGATGIAKDVPNDLDFENPEICLHKICVPELADFTWSPFN